MTAMLEASATSWIEMLDERSAPDMVADEFTSDWRRSILPRINGDDLDDDDIFDDEDDDDLDDEYDDEGLDDEFDLDDDDDLDDDLDLGDDDDI